MKALLFLLIGHHTPAEVAMIKANAADTRAVHHMMVQGEMSNLRGRQINAKIQARLSAFAERNKCATGVTFSGPSLACAAPAPVPPQPKPEPAKPEAPKP